jgi:hypothetical protein
MVRLARRLFLAPHLSCLLAIVGMASFGAGPALAAQFLVLNTTDTVPPQPGSLRAAIELSEGNGEPDSIAFVIDAGTIELVAPLPTLAEGGLEIGRPRTNPLPPINNAVTISGVNGVPYAIRVRSPKNTIANFDFVDFAGPEVVLIDGAGATGNLVSGCVFGRDEVGGTNAGAAIRIVSDLLVGGTPSTTEIRVSRFVRNGFGIVLDGDGPVPLDRVAATIRDNWFGTDAFGAAGPGTGEAIRARESGRVFVFRNRFSGPGNGIVLEQGSDRSSVNDNDLGLRNSSQTDCSGFTGAAVRIEGTFGVAVANNVIQCSQFGVSLGPGAAATVVRDNVIGGPTVSGLHSHGIVLDGTGSAVIRNNTISGAAGFGITETNAPSADPSSVVLSCNSIFANGAGALNLPSVVTPPPLLSSATPLFVSGEAPNLGPGWIEMFGDDSDQARLFQGSTRMPNDVDGFTHLIPVLGLRLGKEPGGTTIDFDNTIPANHTATLGPDGSATTELSSAIAAAPSTLYDIIRGELKYLAPGTTGGVSLGPVVCLSPDLDPTTPPLPDPTDPLPGEGFFYVVRRDDLLTNQNGTYDPAVCSLDSGTFHGPRKATSGDCD